jgi:hypothetical protein
MSSVRDIIYSMLMRDPSLYSTKSDCFKHLFLDGLGYRWVNGELEPDDGKLNTQPNFRDERPGDLEDRWINHNLRFALKHIDFILEDSINFDDFDFVSEYAPLLHVPDNVKPEWEDAVYEAMRALMIAVEHRKRPTIPERNLAHDFPEIQRRMRALHGRFFASELTDPLFERDE